MVTLKYRLGGTLDVDQSLSWGAKIQKKDSRKPNVLKFTVLQTTTPGLNDEVLYYDLDNVQIFGGYIQKITDNTGVQTIEVGDYSVELGQERFSDVYEGVSPEAIIENIITTYTGLTYVSTIVTGITISKIVFKDAWLIDAVTQILELFGGTYTVDLSKNFNMGLSAGTTCTRSLVYGQDQLDGGWNTDIALKSERVIVLGAVIDQRTTETLTGTGTYFHTAYTPENVEITGLTQTTENISGDYTVNIQDKSITFNASKTDPVVSYTYKSQVRVELGSGKTVMLEKKYIESKLEARKLAIEYKTRFEDGSQSAKWIKNSSEIGLYNVDDMIYVTDEKNNKTGLYKIQEVILELPKKLILDIGETDEDLFDWQKETIDRIKQLEDTNSNAEYITVYDFLNTTVNVNVNIDFVKFQTVTNNGTILFASETTLATDGDLISDTGADEDFALAYDDGAIPAGLTTDYLV
ncbi:MAG: hypothetical protein K0A90_00110 [Methanosarcinaceae archaeon]|nr:hypothetical protein [Methanosarcinaceae archaeon]